MQRQKKGTSHASFDQMASSSKTIVCSLSAEAAEESLVSSTPTPIATSDHLEMLVRGSLAGSGRASRRARLVYDSLAGTWRSRVDDPQGGSGILVWCFQDLHHGNNRAKIASGKR